MLLSTGLSLLLSASLTTAAKYSDYILAPNSRTLHPASVYKVNGTVDGADTLTGDQEGRATFSGPSAVTYDFGKNIAGRVTLNIGSVDEDQLIGLTFSESSLWISGVGSDGTADAGLDEILWFHPTAAGDVSVAPEHERGGFRYLSLIHNSTGSVEVRRVDVYFTAMPHWEDDQLGAYTGWFHCDDELINRVWYAGAYTNQLCTIDPHYGNSLVHLNEVNSSMLGDETPPQTWYNNYTITNGSSALVDGAKRDRLVWAGDMAIAVPGVVVSTNDLITVANSLDSLFAVQNKTSGQLPWAGRPFPLIPSATYHMYTLIGVADYYLYSDSLEYLQGKWEAWKQALELSISQIDASGMMNVTAPNDWLRSGMGGHNIEANSILYYTIYQGITLGQAVGEEQTTLDSWQSKAEGIKTAANALLWNATTNLYHDNETTLLSPQDGNTWAILSNLTTPSRAPLISTALRTRWGPHGAPAPEAQNAISPFISGFELQAHILASHTASALALIRLQWGAFMLDDPRMTNSTFIEGYAFDGTLHYAPYTNDARVSHAHGWATGPSSTLSFYIGGIRLLAAGGQEWEIHPRPGDLTALDVGYETNLGLFECVVNATGNGTVTGLRFSTPEGTRGNVVLEGGGRGFLRSGNGSRVELVEGEARGLFGGTLWEFVAEAGNATSGGWNGTGTGTGSAPPEQQTGGAVRVEGVSMLGALLVGLVVCLM